MFSQVSVCPQGGATLPTMPWGRGGGGSPVFGLLQGIIPSPVSGDVCGYPLVLSLVLSTGCPLVLSRGTP